MVVIATLEEFEERTNGGCISCGELTYRGVEPDAKEYPCESCGENKVFGLEQLLVMDQLKLENFEE